MVVDNSGNHQSLQTIEKIGRDGEIRTRDPLNPIQVRYQTAPRPGLLVFLE
jgi:hypothetical protein